jgi:hypothetical protein
MSNRSLQNGRRLNPFSFAHYAKGIPELRVQQSSCTYLFGGGLKRFHTRMRTRLFVPEEYGLFVLESHNRKRRASDVFDKRPMT